MCRSRERKKRIAKEDMERAPGNGAPKEGNERN
jgi:hypothetical protein